MLERIIQYSIKHKLIVLIFSLGIVSFGLYSLTQLSIGAVPDVTNNQVQVITTSRKLATEDVEKFLTYPIELEMANLPGVKEIRSVSKFGLSVVTVVFEDDMGTYLPRQLIAEKIKSAEEKIPASFGKPFMGPISTGLGEIYQYIIDVEKTHRDDYSLSDLRTIQDWIVKRQLSGIPGVVEVNTWGGFLKQYEVAINPEKLRSLEISISETFAALQNNNNIAGGGYIEKVNQTYFIRGEGLASSLEDIENIVIKNRDGIPVYIRDVAEVGFGHATRFGAITGNGEGEKVLGQVMMLKGAGSKEVIEAVKERVAEIQPTLPPGIKINAFLDRSELVGRTTFTIAENLILGCLIVIFVVVLLLGNWRSGLVVASVIPLSLLFAISLMYLFDVDANLMSLGAIDFGIIIDGAVIIVEYISYSITQKRGKLNALPPEKRQGFIDDIAQKSASKMMHSAVFGQLIIIIVFIPILSLVGVEGKMFRPMALVFCFALIGAMLLCFTYVPVVASIFIKASDPNKSTLSSKLIGWLENRYQPTLSWALRRKKWVLGMASAVLIGVAVLFSQMGGEFIPTLDEGDFVIQPVLKTGTTLSKTIQTTTQIEQILLGFPEVLQVVSRIGAAEVPTDPMSMEESDVIIRLKPQDEWETADSKDELANEFKEALSILPGIDYEFTQPIEMRFNELITGVRADVAIKVFGEDLDILYHKALEIEEAISGVEGAADISVEKIDGLPQMSVQYDRRRIAKYGLNIQALNEVVSMGFAGLEAGMIFEGEKQFELVIRFDSAHHQNLEDIQRASVLMPDGNKLPLTEFGKITYTKGPAKISRDDTKRRIVIGVNVRGRDMESVVQDIQGIINREITLPVGYTIDYGGQFENLRTATRRLLWAVPIALLLIFMMLYFAFNSVKEALIIYSAIPLSAVGGILLLYIRGMPFSISAGVGFIALFGIAVLNGIVLIEEFKELKADGEKNLNKRILKGTKKRMRPVLLTASAAALGFLPMAISTSAGAEVQRPLATVVVGGLISATFLTLVVLPVLYALFEQKSEPSKKKHKMTPAILLLAFFIWPAVGKTQAQTIPLKEAVEVALQNNRGLKASVNRVNRRENLTGSAFDLDKTQLFYSYDENNIAPNNLPLRVWGISQSLQFPSVYGAQKRVMEGEVLLAKDRLQLDRRMVAKEVSKAYFEGLYWQALLKKYEYLDSLYTQFSYAANRRYQEGETNYLEKLTAETKKKSLTVEIEQVQEQMQHARIALNGWLQSDTSYWVEDKVMQPLSFVALDTVQHPQLQYYSHAIKVSEWALSVEKNRLLPDLEFSVFRGTNSGENARVFMGFEAGISIPLWFGAQKSKINAAQNLASIREMESENVKRRLGARYEGLLSDARQFQKGIDYYQETGREMAEALLLHANAAYQSGEIDFLQFVQLLENAQSIEMNYLSSLFQYNMTVLEINYIL